MSEDWPESRREFERMRKRHRPEIDRAIAEIRRKREELKAGLVRLRAEMAAARNQFERAVAAGQDQVTAARKYRDRIGAWPVTKRPGKRRRAPRGFKGGEPVPVEPRPKPTPLTDGAEAPID